MLRYAVFLIFIVVGFILSHHRKLYPIVVVIYGIALFYYTFLSRMELATTTEAVVATSAPVVVRGKLILQLHGNEFFHRTVSSFCVVRYGLLSLHGKHFFISGGKQIFIAAVRTFFLCSK